MPYPIRKYSLNKQQLMAIKAYMYLHGCKIGLSKLPMIDFIYKDENGKILYTETINIHEIVRNYQKDEC